MNFVSGFDAGFFAVSPREAAQMDPQQRLVLELAWEICEDAGIRPAALAQSRTGVFVGAIAEDYAHLMYPRGAVTAHTLTGVQRGLIANRVSYVLGLRGPSLTVDTGLSIGWGDRYAYYLALQYIDITGITMPITKFTYMVRDVEKLADVVRDSFALARSGRPGPVFIDITREAYPEPQKLASWWSYRAADFRKSARGLRLDHILLSPGLRQAAFATGRAQSVIHEDVRAWERPSDHAPVSADLQI